MKRKKAKARGKKAAKKKDEAPSNKPPLEVVKDEDPPPKPEGPPKNDVEVEPKPEMRPLNPVDALRYKFAMLQEELIGEKKKSIALKRTLLSKDEEILTLRKETADLRETVVTREEQDLFNNNISLLEKLGVGENEEVLIESGRLFVAPKGTAKQRRNG